MLLTYDTIGKLLSRPFSGFGIIAKHWHSAVCCVYFQSWCTNHRVFHLRVHCLHLGSSPSHQLSRMTRSWGDDDLVLISAWRALEPEGSRSKTEFVDHIWQLISRIRSDVALRRPARKMLRRMQDLRSVYARISEYERRRLNSRLRNYTPYELLTKTERLDIIKKLPDIPYHIYCELDRFLGTFDTSHPFPPAPSIPELQVDSESVQVTEVQDEVVDALSRILDGDTDRQPPSSPLITAPAIPDNPTSSTSILVQQTPTTNGTHESLPATECHCGLGAIERTLTLLTHQYETAEKHWKEHQEMERRRQEVIEERRLQLQRDMLNLMTTLVNKLPDKR